MNALRNPEPDKQQTGNWGRSRGVKTPGKQGAAEADQGQESRMIKDETKEAKLQHTSTNMR